MASQAGQLCLNCGAEVNAGNKFCQSCGKAVAPPVPAAPPASVAPPTPAPPAVDQGHFTQVKQIYGLAANVNPAQRDGFLQNACRGDQALLHELRSMFVTEDDKRAGPPPTGAADTQMIGVYKVMREIGRGGMGVVYLAVRDDGAFRKNVALKLLLREHVSAEFVTRFKQERQVLAALDHPNIARILDGGDTQEAMPYYVMEYVEGLPLDRYCDQQRLSLSGRIKIFQQVCLAVDYLHQNSILHRDLKPSNILVTSDGVVKLLDFGIAKVVGAGSWANADLTGAQGRPMTPTYASPEQITGGTLTKTSDLYSLGAILYGLLTGRSAYIDLDDKLAKIAAREAPTVPSANIREDLRSAETTQQFRRAMMGELDSIVLMTMQIDPKNRYQSAADLAQDLQHFLDGSPVTAHHGTAAGRGVKLLKRRRASVAILCGFLLVVALGTLGWLRLEQEKANSAKLGVLIDRLQAKVDKLAPGETPPVADVQTLKEAFDKDYASAPAADQDKLLAKGIKYLDKVHAAAPDSPNLNEDVGDAYSKLGTLQEKDAKSAEAGHAALNTYRKAAITLASAAPTQQKAKTRLQDVNARIRALGGTTAVAAEPVTSSNPLLPAEPVKEMQTAKTVPVAKVPRAQSVIEPPPPPPPMPAPGPVKQAISAETEDQLINVTSRVQIAEQAIAPIRQNLERDGQSLNPDTLMRIERMRASLERAKRAVSNGDESQAKESLAAADALASKLLSSVGR